MRDIFAQEAVETSLSYAASGAAPPRVFLRAAPGSGEAHAAASLELAARPRTRRSGRVLEPRRDCIQVKVRLRRRHRRCRKRQWPSCRRESEAGGRTNRSFCTRLRNRGGFRLRVVSPPADGAADVRAAVCRTADDERERPYRRLPLASGASAAGRPRAAGAPARPSPRQSAVKKEERKPPGSRAREPGGLKTQPTPAPPQPPVAAATPQHGPVQNGEKKSTGR